MKDETHQWVHDALDFSFTKTRHNLSTLTSFPERTDSNGQWIQTEPNLNGWWVGGHWVGLLWLAYAATKDDSFNSAARDWANRLLPRRPELDDHDLGFLFEVGFVLGYQFTGDEKLKAPALQAASTLSQRFNPRGRFIQAWGLLDASPELRGRTIMDTMMNLDLLFWASKETGDAHYAEIAAPHARTTLPHHLRLHAMKRKIETSDPLEKMNWFKFIYIVDEKHIKTGNPIYPGCDCYTCLHYTIGYLHHLYKIDDPLYFRLGNHSQSHFYE